MIATTSSRAPRPRRDRTYRSAAPGGVHVGREPTGAGRAADAPCRAGGSGRRPRPDRTESASSRDGVRIGYEVYGDGEPTIVMLPTWTDRARRALEGAGALPGAALPRGHRRRPRATAASDRPPARRRTPTRSTPPTRRRARRDRHRAGGARRAVRAAPGAPCSPPRTRTGWRGSSRSRLAPSTPDSRATRPRSTTCSTPTRAGPSTTALLARATGRLRRVLLRRVLRRAALDQADRGRRRLGAWRPPRTSWSTTTPRRLGSTPRAGSRAVRAPSAARCWSSTAPTTGASPRRSAPRLRRADRRRRWSPCEGAGHAAAWRARPGAVNRADHATFVGPVTGGRRRPRRGRARRGAREPRGALPLLADRARATPAATSRSPTSCASCAPTCEIDWLAQHPVTRVPRGRAASGCTRRRAWLASESAHIEAEAGEHDLHAFQAIRRMDEILVANFMVFDDLVARRALRPVGRRRGLGRSTTSCTRTPSSSAPPFAWMTDFVGWLPMPDGGEREACLTADYNAEMIEHVARYPRLRDRSVFVGDPDDVVARPFGPGPADDPRLDRARTSTSPGYVTGFDAGRDPPDRAGAARRARATPTDEPVCVVSVGGSGVGGHLLRRVRRRATRGAPSACRGCGWSWSTGPRIDPASLPAAAGRRGARLRARPLPAPRGLRRRGRAGRADDHDGADREPAGRSSTSRCATTSSRTSTCATGCERHGAGRRDGLRRRRTRTRSPTRSSRRSAGRSTTSRWIAGGAARAAAHSRRADLARPTGAAASGRCPACSA